jgi:mycofactocin precursor
MADPTAPAPMHDEAHPAEQLDAADRPHPAEQPHPADRPHAENGLVLDELLVEDVSIDGMCGVY